MKYCFDLLISSPQKEAEVDKILKSKSFWRKIMVMGFF